MIDLVDEPLDSRTVQYMLANTPAQDGGQWDLAVGLVEEFGLVPQTVYPESFNSSNSAALDALLTSKLREMGLKLRKAMLAHLSSGVRKKEAMAAARDTKDRMLKEIWRILTTTCGEPPKPDEPVSLHPLLSLPRRFLHLWLHHLDRRVAPPDPLGVQGQGRQGPLAAHDAARVCTGPRRLQLQ